MVEISDKIVAIVNKPGRIGTLSTVDSEGKPNVAYFGSPRFMDDGTFVLSLMSGRTIKNLEANPHAVFFCVEEGPVSFSTPGCRLYLQVREIQTEGPILEMFKKAITERVGPDAAKGLKAAVTFDVTEVRGLVDKP